MKAVQTEGKLKIPVLFEVMDGVWLSMQSSSHKKMKKQEMKVLIMYEGWDSKSKGRNRLVNRAMLDGMKKGKKR